MTSAQKVLFVAIVGSFFSSLTGSVVGVILPGIGKWAGVGVQDVAWVTLVPMLAIAALLLPAGWAGDTRGHRQTYITGCFLAVVGSLGCTVAPNFAVLLIFRGVQGAGAALTMASSPALVSLTTDPLHRGGALGLTSTAIYAGLTLGPPLGGWLNSIAGFRLVFLVQVPISLLLLFVSTRMLPRVNTVSALRSKGLDWVGSIILAAGITSVLLALGQRGQIFGLAGAALLGAFFLIERHARNPLLDLGLFSSRTFVSASAGAVLNYIALSHATFLVPFYLVETRHMDTDQAGVLLMVTPLVMTLVTGPSGHLSDRIGSRSLASVGMVVLAVGLSLLSLSISSSLWMVTATLGLVGVGTGLFVSPNTNTLLSSAPRRSQGSAAGIMALARTLGMMLGVALAAGIHDTVRALGETRGIADSDLLGYQVAWCVGAVVALAGAAVVLIRDRGVVMTQVTST